MCICFHADKLTNTRLRAPAGLACRTPCCSPPSGSWSRKRPPALAYNLPDPRRPSGPTSCRDGSVESPEQRNISYLNILNKRIG